MRSCILCVHSQDLNSRTQHSTAQTTCALIRFKSFIAVHHQARTQLLLCVHRGQYCKIEITAPSSYSIPSPEKQRQARIQLLLHDHRVKNSKIEITVPSFNSIPSPEKHHQARIQLLLCVHRVKNSKLKKQHPLLFQYPHQRSTVRHAYSSSFMSTE